jgi:deoxyribodipyrimidine photo-lyase
MNSGPTGDQTFLLITAGKTTDCDYESYSRKRDAEVEDFLLRHNISFHSFKDQVIFEYNEVLKSDGKPYTVYTPYKNKWLEEYHSIAPVPEYDATNKFSNFHKNDFAFPFLNEIGFVENELSVEAYKKCKIAGYTLEQMQEVNLLR